jgi:serine/threonine protein kinase
MSEAGPPAFSGGGRFEIVRRIGAGGMGVVYEAIDNERRTRVALKSLPHVEAEALLRFKQEFRNLTDVTHPNLAALYELFSTGEEWFFSMELVEGVDFLAHLGRRNEGDVETTDRVVPPSEISRTPTQAFFAGVPEEKAPPARSKGSASPLPAAQVPLLRDALRQLVEGLTALHDAGKMHRDIKPSNVLVARDGRVVILDFGLTSGLQDERDRPENRAFISGTAGYMAPEQSAGRPLTAACDWYAVGAMLYEALTGRLPHRGTVREVLLAKQVRDPPPPSEIVAGIPGDLDDLCRRLLRLEPSDRPGGREILALLEARRSTDPGVVRAEAPARPPFVGRQRQLGILHAGFERVREGRPTAIFVHGRSGAGKSYLVQEFLDAIQEHDGALTLRGRCYEAEWVPYKGIDSLVDDLSQFLEGLPKSEVAAVLPRDVRALVRIFPVLRRIEAIEEAPGREAEIPNQQELRRRAFRALKELLARLGDRRPLVLAIDDLQWGDLDSAALLGELLRPPDPPILLLLGIYRSEYAEASPSLQRLLAGPPEGTADVARRTLEVDPLTEEEARALALEMLGEDTPRQHRLAEEIARESGGIPYFVHELVQYVREGAELVRPGAAEPSISLEEVLRRRLDALPGETRRLLEIISVSGRPLRQGDAYRAAAMPSADVGALTFLRKGHMVRSTGPSDRDSVETYHDRIREAVVAQLAPSERSERHRTLAVALESAGGYDPETLAIHLAEAGERERAGAYYAQAAAAAAETLAFERAANLYRLSLSLRPAAGEEGRKLRTALGDALANAGRGAEAAGVYREAEAQAGPADALELLRRAAYQYCVSGHVREGRAAMRELLGRMGMTLPEKPGAVLVSLLARRARLRLRGLSFRERDERAIPPEVLRESDVTWSASAGLSMIDIIAGASFQTRNLILALRAGEPARIARALAWEAAHSSNDGSPGWKRTRKLLDAADGLARRVGNPHPIAMATMARGVAEFTMGRWAAAVPLLGEAESILRDRCTGVTWELDTAHTFSLWALVYQGKFAEMSGRAAQLAREAEERGDLYVQTNLGTFMQPHARLAADDPEGARAAVRRALEMWSAEGFHLQDLTALMSDTLIDLYEGRGGAAWNRISGQWVAVKRSQMLRIQVLRIVLRHFRGRSALAAALAAADPRPSIRAALSDARRIAREGIPWAAPMAASLRAGAAALAGDRVSAAALLSAAAAGFDEAGMLSYASAARRRLGEIEKGEEGARMVERADGELRAQGVENPAKMTRMHVTGFPD